MNAGLSFELAHLARQKGFSVYICSNVKSYRLLAEELACFLQDSPELLWLFPAWEVMAYDRVSPHHAIVSQRLKTLQKLMHSQQATGLLITSLPAWMQHIAGPDIFEHIHPLILHDKLDHQALEKKFLLAGMQPAQLVAHMGEFCVRQGILDLWTGTEKHPVRIRFDEKNRIQSMHYFEPSSQRTLDKCMQCTILPLREVVMDDNTRRQFIKAFSKRFPHLRDATILQQVKAKKACVGIESLLPLAYEGVGRLSDYLPDAYQLYGQDDLPTQQQSFAAQVRSRFEVSRHAKLPILAPEELYDLHRNIPSQHFSSSLTIEAAPQLKNHSAVSVFMQHLWQYMDEGWSLCLLAHASGQQERMIEQLCQHIPLDVHDIECLSNIAACQQTRFSSTLAYIDQGFMLKKEKRLFLTGRELLGQHLPRRQSKRIQADVFDSMQSLQENELLVHEQHGMGRYLGLITMEERDFLHLAYARDSSLYVPVEDMHLLHRYGSQMDIKLDRLGHERWKKRKEQVEKDILAIATELIATDSARKKLTRERPTHDQSDDAAYEQFVARFPFEETEEQLAAIRDVEKDLRSPHLMDRVICGDVGFGKTEVALRAAFMVAQQGRQVAVLAPTTVLANQHESSFMERFAGTGLEVAILSRLQSRKEITACLKAMQEGLIDIVVGTHRLLSQDISFSDLGLVIVDEEHRFGVKHKEKLKRLYRQADLLSMSATPIPRTLHQSLSGLRSVSIISTPPTEREAVMTLVAEHDESMIQDAIRRELYRGGQVYYLHNHVNSIGRVAQDLRELIPEAEVGVAHGQMSATQLDERMLAFYEGQLNILVCTTIVESGLDVANANTLIVERADKLGLSQLHQLRGRVGRSHRQAYAYLFTPADEVLSDDAKSRLDAIQRHTELGAGFALARHDMDIRGVGNLLGTEQSGRIDAVGLELYMDMLNQALHEEQDPQNIDLDIDLHVHAILGQQYIPQTEQRLALYRRIAKITSDEQVDALHDEMFDRFGALPQAAKCCLQAAKLRWRARHLQLNTLDVATTQTRFGFSPDSPVDRMKLMTLLQTQPKMFHLHPQGDLLLMHHDHDDHVRLQQCCQFIDEQLKG
ncbi:MAG: transcription-repair coupling factor [Mariprofundaceae bacterium]|nr:transcription-repair coupling factor [Mariprofundaceae bacterium]